MVSPLKFGNGQVMTQLSCCSLSRSHRYIGLTPNHEWHCSSFHFSGMGYIVGANVASALGAWYWALRVSSKNSINSLAPGKFEWNFRHVIFKQILVIDGWGICCEIALTWMPLDFTDDQSTMVQMMAWCHEATSHHLSQCWPRSLSPSGITRPQCVKICLMSIIL